MMAEENVFKKLFVDEKEVTRELESQVENAAKIFSIEKPSGRVMFKNFGELNDKQRIAALLVAKYFAQRAGLEIPYSLSVSEISKELGRPMTTLSGSINELIKAGLIEKLPDRMYRIAYQRIGDIFESVLSESKRKR